MIREIVIIGPPVSRAAVVGESFWGMDDVVDKIVQEDHHTFKIVGEDGKHLGVINAQNYYLIYF